MHNKYGLTRDIPIAIKRLVRKRCGYGCVICGRAIVQYHHFDPPFAEAKSHAAESLTLLCGTCHDKQTRGLLTDDVVRRFNANPICHRRGFTQDDFLFALQVPYAELGDGTCSLRCKFPILYDHHPVLSFSDPEEDGAPVRLNAEFNDDRGGTIINIEDNEWRARADHIDLETSANRLLIRDATSVILELSHSAVAGPRVSRLQMLYKGFQVNVTKDRVEVTSPQGKSSLVLEEVTVVGEVGLRLSSTGITCLGGRRPATPEEILAFDAQTKADYAVLGLHNGHLKDWEFTNSLAILPLFAFYNLTDDCPLSISLDGENAKLPLFTSCERALAFADNAGIDISIITTNFNHTLKTIGEDTAIIINPDDRFGFDYPIDHCRLLREIARVGERMLAPPDFTGVKLTPEIIRSLRLAAHPNNGRR